MSIEGVDWIFVRNGLVILGELETVGADADGVSSSSEPDSSSPVRKDWSKLPVKKLI